MHHQTISPSRKFQNFNDAANQILNMLSKQMDINTLFIAENDGKTNTIKKAFNRHEELVVEDSQSPLDQTFCSLAINYGQEPLLIEDISKDDNAGKLEISRNSATVRSSGSRSITKVGKCTARFAAWTSNRFRSPKSSRRCSR